MHQSIRSLLILFALAVSPGIHAATAHDNHVYFTAKSGIASLAFSPNEYHASQGQPIDRPAPDWDASRARLTVNIHAGRHASNDMADAFNRQLYPWDGPYGGAIAYELYAPTMGFRPGQLNFWANGTLTINGRDQYSIVMGQGSYGGSANNWWIGGPSLTGFMTSNQGAYLPSGQTEGSLVTLDGKYKIDVGGDDHTFTVTPLYPQARWMGGIDDGTLLAGISMPGTHDSATYAFGYESLIYDYETQGLSLLSQLNLGARFLDLRLCMGKDRTVHLCHGSVNAQITLADGLNQVLRFLGENPTETVILLLKNEHLGGGVSAGDLGQAVRDDLRAVGLNHFYMDNASPTLGQTRGKAVIIVRDGLGGNIADLGINVVWQDDTTFTSPKSPYDGSLPLTVNFSIQDDYNIVAGPVGWSDKLDDAVKLINQTKGSIGNRWFINYLSATAGSSVWLVAQGVNSRATSKFGELSGSVIGGFGATLMDYLGTSTGTTFNVANDGSDLVSILIRQNAFNSVSSTVSFAASHAEVGSPDAPGREAVGEEVSTRDRYRINMTMKFKPGTFDPTQALGPLSRIHVRDGSYQGDRQLGKGTRIRLIQGKPGKAVFVEPGKDITTIRWNSRRMDIVVRTPRPRTDGVNIARLAATRGRLTGQLASQCGIDSLSAKAIASYRGRASVRNLQDGRQVNAWHIRSTGSRPAVP